MTGSGSSGSPSLQEIVRSICIENFHSERVDSSLNPHLDTLIRLLVVPIEEAPLAIFRCDPSIREWSDGRLNSAGIALQAWSYCLAVLDKNPTYSIPRKILLRLALKLLTLSCSEPASDDWQEIAKLTEVTGARLRKFTSQAGQLRKEISEACLSFRSRIKRQRLRNRLGNSSTVRMADSALRYFFNFYATWHTHAVHLWPELYELALLMTSLRLGIKFGPEMSRAARYEYGMLPIVHLAKLKYEHMDRRPEVETGDLGRYLEPFFNTGHYRVAPDVMGDLLTQAIEWSWICKASSDSALLIACQLRSGQVSAFWRLIYSTRLAQLPVATNELISAAEKCLNGFRQGAYTWSDEEDRDNDLWRGVEAVMRLTSSRLLRVGRTVAAAYWHQQAENIWVTRDGKLRRTSTEIEAGRFARGRTLSPAKRRELATAWTHARSQELAPGQVTVHEIGQSGFNGIARRLLDGIYALKAPFHGGPYILWEDVKFHVREGDPLKASELLRLLAMSDPVSADLEAEIRRALSALGNPPSDGVRGALPDSVINVPLGVICLDAALHLGGGASSIPGMFAFIRTLGMKNLPADVRHRISENFVAGARRANEDVFECIAMLEQAKCRHEIGQSGILELLNILIKKMQRMVRQSRHPADLFDTTEILSEFIGDATEWCIREGYDESAFRLSTALLGTRTLAIAKWDPAAVSHFLRLEALRRLPSRPALRRVLRSMEGPTKYLRVQPLNPAEGTRGATSDPIEAAVRGHSSMFALHATPEGRIFGLLAVRNGTSDLDFHVRELPISHDALAALRELVWAELRPSSHQGSSRSLETLHNLLIAPIEDLIADTQSFIVVPSEILGGLPLQAAYSGEGYLIEKMTVQVISHLFPRWPQVRAREIFVGGWNEEIGAREEAKTLAELIKSTPYPVMNTPTGAAAAIDKLRRYSETGEALKVIHIASHGINDAWPKSLDSRLDLDGVSMITVSDWIKNFPDSELVFLNSCFMGRLGTKLGDLTGFLTGVLAGGRPTVISAEGYLTPEDAASFAYEFYSTLFETDSLSAHQAAAKKMIDLEKHPRSWASYMHIGTPVPFGQSWLDPKEAKLKLSTFHRDFHLRDPRRSE